MTVINTNVSALVAQNAMTANGRAQSAAMQQLSTGQRISSAKDDAAGLAISAKMTSQIRGLDQSVRNANDGISLLQTGEGALVEVSNMMQRMRELAVQSATDTNTTDDRAALNGEFGQLKSEINRIVSNTQWNGMNILDATTNSGVFKFQVGANASQTISKTINSMGFGTSSGTAVTASAIASNVQTATTTFGGTYAENDVITLNVNNKTFQYTVSAANVAGATAGDDLKLIANAVGTALTASFAGLTVAHTTDALTLTFAGAANASFNASGSANNGALAAISELAVTSQGSSSTAITSLDAAIKAVNTERADMGATINRLTYASDNLTNVSQNTSASRSRVLDTDYAKSSTELARTQIISQAATAMLAQANQSQQSVLALLK